METADTVDKGTAMERASEEEKADTVARGTVEDLNLPVASEKETADTAARGTVEDLSLPVALLAQPIALLRFRLLNYEPSVLACLKRLMLVCSVQADYVAAALSHPTQLGHEQFGYVYHVPMPTPVQDPR